MKTKLLLVMWFVLSGIIASAQYTFPACWTPWASSSTGYQKDAQVSHKKGNYKAKWYTTTEPGTSGDWELVSKCGDGGLGPDYVGPQRIIGYLPYWVPDFNMKTYDPAGVTHLVVAFNLFQQNNNDFNSANFASIAWGAFHNRKVDSTLFDNGLLNRARTKGVKVSVAIGGATDFAFLWLLTRYYNNDAKLEEMANFITNYVNAKGIDGVDLDLECWWPDATISGTTEQGGRVRGDKWGGPDQGPHPAGLGLTRLAQKLRAKMPTKLISAAVFATSYYGNNYDDGLGQYVDWLGLMTYDFTGSWNTSPVGPHSALYKVPLNTYQGQTADNPIYSAQDALEYWMGFAPAAWNHDGGFNVPKAKLAIGVPFYGYDLATRKPNNGNGFVALKWKEILASYPSASTSYDPLDQRQLGGYIGADGKKIYFDTPRAAGEKIKYTKNYGHQGVIIWEITGDVAFSNSNSLLKAISDAAGNNPPPAVSISSPTNNARFATGSNITISANATDNVSVTRVEFFYNSTRIGEDTSAPYSIVWNAAPNGSYVLTAKATDNQGASTTSSGVNIVVGNAPPSATITSPADNSRFSTGSTITINATATDSDGTISKVEFYNGTTKLGEDLTSPYSWTISNAVNGSYSVTARAFDNLSAFSNSTAVRFTVGNSAPTVSITSPANNAAFNAPATITIQASATDSDGSITKVEFYNGSTLLGTDTSSPYSFIWSGVPVGTYPISAKATDNLGATATSATVSVIVRTADNCSSIAQYTENGGYVAGSLVKNAGSQYECRPWPNSGWCNGAAWAYAPGTGMYWQDAWTLKGSCTSSASEGTVVVLDETSAANDGLSIYPNPGTTDQRQLTLLFHEAPGNVNISILNANGMNLRQHDFKDHKEKKVTVDLPVMNSGMYLIKVKGANRTWTKKYFTN
jgi:GH18 family chitinase